MSIWEKITKMDFRVLDTLDSGLRLQIWHGAEKWGTWCRKVGHLIVIINSISIKKFN